MECGNAPWTFEFQTLYVKNLTTIYQTHSCQWCTWTEHTFGVRNPCMSRIWQKAKDTLTTMCTWIDIWVPNMYVKMLTNSVHKSTWDILSFKQVSRIWGSLQFIHYMWSSFQELLWHSFISWGGFLKNFSEVLYGHYMRKSSSPVLHL